MNTQCNAGAVSIVEYPPPFSDFEKWDLADQPPAQIKLDDLRQMLTEAKPFGEAVPDYAALKTRAESLTPESHPDQIAEVVLLSVRLGSVHRAIIMKIVKDKTGTTIESQKNLMRENDETANGEPDHLTLARAVIADIGRENLLATVAHVWLWNKDVGVWKSIPDRLLKQIVQRVIEDTGEGVYRGLVDGVTEIAKSETFRPEHRWNQNRDVINFKNGELHWMVTGWELKIFVREHYLTTQIPHNYNPSATCPRFLRFLDEIFDGDADSKQKKQALLEMMGYSLTTNTAFERFALLIGGGANGKSVVMGILEHMLGVDNICAVQPSEFTNKFQRAHMHGKLANLVTEIAEGGVIADDKLKAIVSGETITAEHKNQPPFDFSPFCTCWFGTNHMPHTRDFSDALFRRALVMPFNKTFKAGVNADPRLKETLKGEVEGILVLVLNAYGQVLQTGKMTEPESCLAAKNKWRMEADQVAQFVEEVCIRTPQWNTLSSELYKAYTNWAQEVGIRQKLGRNTFTERLERLGFEKKKGTAGARMITGIELRKL